MTEFKEKYPKVLIVGRVAWTSGQSTLSSIFSGFPPDRLAYICIETQIPDFVACSNHFQISEIALLKWLFHPNTKTGYVRYPHTETKEEKLLEKKENSAISWVRKHRSILFLYIRELLWKFGGWKSKEIKRFIKDFDPDVLFFVGDPLPLMCQLQRYVYSFAECPASIFIMDDIWSYKSCGGLLSLAYRWLLRIQVKKLIPLCKKHFVISEMMKYEYDAVFHIESVILTKGIRRSEVDFRELNYPLRLVYTGKLVYGRERSLIEVAESLSKINEKGEKKAELHIYTQTILPNRLKRKLDLPGVSYLHKPVPYCEIASILDASDIVLFVESLEKRHRYTARLSFSTKITDYLSSGKCLVAIGDPEIAPIRYLKENQAAMICSDYKEIVPKIKCLVNSTSEIRYLAEKAYLLGCKKHGKEMMDDRLLKGLTQII